MNRAMRNNNAMTICPECKVMVHDTRRHKARGRCLFQHGKGNKKASQRK